jgi:hypothetical protein
MYNLPLVQTKQVMQKRKSMYQQKEKIWKQDLIQNIS